MKRLNLLFIFIFQFSCSLAPDITQPDINHPDKFNQLNSLVTSENIMAKSWWKEWQNDSLNRLIETMIHSNLDIRIFLERIKQFEAIAGINSATQYPQINAGATAGKSESFMVNNFVPNGKEYISLNNENYKVNGTFMFNLDLLAKFANMSNAALADHEALRLDIHSLYQSLIAQTIQIYTEIDALEKQVILNKTIITTYQNDLIIQENRLKSGSGSGFNLELSKQALYQAQMKDLAENELLKNLKFQLSVLLGRYPDNFQIMNLSSDYNFKSIPVSVPSKLLENRFDIRSAEVKIKAAAYRVGVARADLYPQIGISLDAGWSTKSTADLFQPDLLYKTYGISFTQSLFNGFSKSYAVDQRFAELEQAYFNYQKTVLNAFKELESALLKVSTADKQNELALKSKKSGKINNDLMEHRYRNGIATYQQYLDIKRNYFNSESTAINSAKLKLQSRIALVLACGGQWLETND